MGLMADYTDGGRINKEHAANSKRSRVNHRDRRIKNIENKGRKHIGAG